MRKNLNRILAAAALIAGALAGHSLYAQDAPATSQDPMMSREGMMRGDQGMMGMMGQMSEMMETCNEMMKGKMAKRESERPNEQQQEHKPNGQENRG